MKGKASVAIMLGLFALAVIGCSGEQAVDVKKLMAQPFKFLAPH
jgi:hypothetical protein